MADRTKEMEASSGKATAVFVRMGSRPIPRVVRMMEVADLLGMEPLFCGAFREPDLPETDEWSGLNVTRVGPTFPLLNGRRPLLFLRSVLGFNRAVFRLLVEVRPALVHASDLEVFPAAHLYARRSGARLLYNIHDNLAQRYPVPAMARHILNAVEGLAVLLADDTLVPEVFRRQALPEWSRHKVSVVRNTPQDPGQSPPLDLASGRIRLFYGGWIDSGRGLPVLLQLLDVLPELELRLAGEGDKGLLERLGSHRRVEYLGFLTHAEILAESAASHFIAAMYDPARLINRFAASNKLAEAFAIGRPVLVNSEMAIVDQLRGEACLLSTAYGDVEELALEIRKLVTDPVRYGEACRSARNLYERHYSWEVAQSSAERLLGCGVGQRAMPGA